MDARTVGRAEGDTPSAREMVLRREIASACLAHDLPAAAEKYLQLVQIADDAVLARQNQLDVANQLMAGEQYPAAADAYERLLRHYPNYESSADIYLMLGLLYGRYLHQYDRAEQYLTSAMQGLQDSRKRGRPSRNCKPCRADGSFDPQFAPREHTRGPMISLRVNTRGVR